MGPEPDQRALYSRRFRRGSAHLCTYAIAAPHLRSGPQMDVLNRQAPAVRRRLLVDLLVFHAIAFAITWILVGLYIWDAEAVTDVIGPMRMGAPAFYVAVYGPMLSAIVVTAWRYGRAGPKDLFGALLRIRVKWYWIAISLLAFPGLWL